MHSIDLLADLGREVGERGLAGAGRAGEHDVLAGVDGGHELIEHVLGEVHAEFARRRWPSSSAVKISMVVPYFVAR